MSFKISNVHLPSFMMGLIISAILMWVLFIREPFLTTPADKGSYAIGQKMGKNLLRGEIDYDPRIIRVALEHAKKGKSKLEEKELREGMDYFHNLAAQKGKQRQSTNIANAGAPDHFFTTPWDFTYYPATWSEYIKFRDNPSDPQNSSRFTPIEKLFEQEPLSMDSKIKFKFQIIVRNLQGEVIFDSTNERVNYSASAKELPISLQQILLVLSPQQTLLVNFNGGQPETAQFQWPVQTDHNSIYEIKRL